MKIFPRCKSDWSQIYISAEGYVMPCCWIGNMPHLNDYFKFYAESLDRLSVKNYSLEQIISDPIYLQIEKSWANPQEAFNPCKVFCSKPLRDDQTSFDGTNDTLTIKLK